MKALFEKNRKLLYEVTLILNVLYLYGVTAYGISSLKYIGLYGAITLFLVLLVYDRKLIIESYREVWHSHKLLLTSMLLLMLSIYISMYFSYVGMSELSRSYRVAFLNPSIFSVVLLGIQKENKKTVLYLFVALSFALVQNVVSFGLEYWYTNPNLNLSIKFERQFSVYFDYLFPFTIMAMIYWRKTMLFFLIAIVFGLGELILSGVRGAWGSVIFELLVITSLLFYYQKNYRKKIVGVMFILAFIGAGSFYFAYNHSGWVQYKLSQGLHTSGRDRIVNERLPIFLEHGNKLVGIGGPGNVSYNKFFNDFHVPHDFGQMENGTFHFYSDEPFFLNVFYKEGIIGLIVLIWLLILLTFKMLSFISKVEKDSMLFYFGVALFSSFAGYYFVRGLVELRTFTMLLFYIGLYIVAFQKYKERIKR